MLGSLAVPCVHCAVWLAWALQIALSGMHGHCACVSQCHMGTAHSAVWLAWALCMCVTMSHGSCRWYAAQWRSTQ